MASRTPQTLFSFLNTRKQIGSQERIRRLRVKAEKALTSSALNIGQAANSESTYKHIEYLGNGGIMEFNSNGPQKRVIEFEHNPETGCDHAWYFAELYLDTMPIDYFDYTEDCDVFDYQDVLKWCCSVLEQSPSAAAMLKEAAEKDWKVSMEDLNGGDYCLDAENRTLVIDNNALAAEALVRSAYFKNATLVILIKALRDIWQEKRHGGFDEIYSPDHIMMMERVRAADLDVLAILVAWELRSEQYTDIWRHMIGSELGDMAMAFSGHLERDPTAQFNGQGLVAAFKQWFRDEARVNACDHDALEYMDEVLAISEMLNPFGKRRPSRMDVEILSCLPDKTAYLRRQGGEILCDPIYSAVDDEINQTHLFHIMHDLEAVVVEDVPFRDPDLARKIFPVESE